MNRDPNGAASQANLYEFVKNNTHAYFDPDGMQDIYWPLGNNVVVNVKSSPPQMESQMGGQREPYPPDSMSIPGVSLEIGRRIGIRVRDAFIQMNNEYTCCLDGGREVLLTEFDGCRDGTQKSWTIAHRITGCELRARGLTRATVDNLNALHEFIEFLRLESFKFTTWYGYVDDTYADMQAILEGFATDGRNCFTRFIPRECQKKQHEQ